MKSLLLVAISFTIVTSSALAATVIVEKVPGGKAELGHVELHGLKAGEFTPEPWQNNTLHLLSDARRPLIAPRQAGQFRNIYAPSAVQTDRGWRVFYGAWDGVPTGNDRIYSLETKDFVDFSGRETVIEHGVFIHCCNVNAHKGLDGAYTMVCTVYPDKDGLNKPAIFTSPDGVKWNGVTAPYPAAFEDIVKMSGYDAYPQADINGVNVLFPAPDGLYLYFNNYKDFGKVYRAKQHDGLNFQFEKTVLETGHAINDLKSFTTAGKTWYLMGLHMNTSGLWYSLSQDPAAFTDEHPLLTSQDDAEKYIVAVGWVTEGNRVLGALYGAGSFEGLNRNRIFARWLQKRVVFVSTDGQRFEPSQAVGPDRQVMPFPTGAKLRGKFELYGEDGQTLIGVSEELDLSPDSIYQFSVKD